MEYGLLFQPQSGGLGTRLVRSRQIPRQMSTQMGTAQTGSRRADTSIQWKDTGTKVRKRRIQAGNILALAAGISGHPEDAG